MGKKSCLEMGSKMRHLCHFYWICKSQLMFVFCFVSSTFQFEQAKSSQVKLYCSKTGNYAHNESSLKYRERCNKKTNYMSVKIVPLWKFALLILIAWCGTKEERYRPVTADSKHLQYRCPRYCGFKSHKVSLPLWPYSLRGSFKVTNATILFNQWNVYTLYFSDWEAKFLKIWL